MLSSRILPLESARIFAASSVLLALTGCGLGVADTTVTPLAEPAMTYGTVQGGNVPIYNATVNLYEAGTGGYGKTTGAAGGAILRATTLTTANGQFSFTNTSSGTNNGTDSTWHCPSDGSDPLIYLISVGGDPNGYEMSPVNYTQIVLAAMIGNCSSINTGTQVGISELSTIGFAASFGQYMYPGTSTPGQEGLSTNGAYVSAAPSTHQSALGAYNAFLNYSNNLIYVPTGGVYSPRTYTGTAASVVGVQVTATAEAGKMVAAANALSACVNSNPTSSTNCNQLFDAAAPPILASATAYGGTFPTAAVDTLQAALFMTALNPGGVNTAAGANTVSGSGPCFTANGTTSNPVCIFDLIGKNPAFTTPAGVTALGAAPSDWSIGITYSAGGGTDVASPASLTLPASNTCSSGTGGAASGPFLWNSVKGAVDAAGNLWFIGGDTTVTTKAANIAEMSPIGQPLLCLGAKSNGTGLTIDPSGNVWGTFANSNTNGLAEIANGSSSISYTVTPNHPYSVASDYSGNIYFAYTATGGTLYKLPSGGGAVSTVLTPVDSGGGTISLNYMAIDQLGDPWMIAKSTTLYNVEQGTGTQYSITSWKTGTPASGAATYTFTGPNSTVFAAGDTITLSGFTSQKAGVGTQPTPAYPVLNGTFTVATATSTAITVSIATSQTVAISTVSTDTGAKASIPSGTFNAVQSSLSVNSYGIAIDSNAYVYTGGTCCGTSTPFRFLTKLTPAANGTAAKTNSATNLGGATGVRSVALDGADNAWLSNEYSGQGDLNSTGFYPVSAIATAGGGTTATFTALTPTGVAMTSTTCSTTVGCPTQGGIEKVDMQYALDIDLDPSGNVWVLNNQAGASSSTANAGTIVEIVGTAVPVLTPISAGIGTSTANSKLATKP